MNEASIILQLRSNSIHRPTRLIARRYSVDNRMTIERHSPILVESELHSCIFSRKSEHFINLVLNGQSMGVTSKMLLEMVSPS